MILVTGASGFLGQRVVKLLLGKGYSVLALSRRAEDTFRPLCTENLGFLQFDLATGPLDWDHPSLSDIDIVIHLAAAVSSGVDAALANIALGLNLLKNTSHRLHGLVLASSVYVYSPDTGRLIDELTPALPWDHYGHAKLFLEKIFSLESEIIGFPLFLLRIASLYGPKEPHGKVITKFAEMVKQGRQPVLSGNVHTQRDYLHVDDAARAVLATVQKIKEGAKGEVYNICSGVGTSVYQIAVILGEIANVTLPEPPAESEHATADLIFDPRRAKQDLGFKSKISLRKGLQMLLELD